MIGTNARNAEPRELPDGFRLTELGPLLAHWRVVRLEKVELCRGRSDALAVGEEEEI